MLDQTASLLAAANLLSLAAAAIGGGLLGRRRGLTLALLLAALNAALDALSGGWNERLVSAGVAGLLALPMAGIVGALRDRARGAQQQAAEAVYARETLEVQVAELVRSEQGLRTRGDQQAVLATISQRALTATDVVALFEDVVRRVAEVFDADAATIWTSAAESQVECRAVHTSRFQHSGAIPETVRKHAHYTLLVNQPVVVDDLHADPRLRGDAPGGSLVCGAAVPIVAHGAPYAVLAVHSNAARSFAPHELIFLQGVADLITATVERNHVEEGLRRQALHDPLTGLANRSLFQDRLALALHAAKREKKPLALMLMDLDRFKEINDTLGHQAGDQLLLEVAARLARSKRATDTVARLGGDEFALILPAVADLSTAARLATELLAAIERPTSLQDQSVDIGASIGLAAYPEHGDDAEELLRRADVAMYAAKRGGLGVAVYASELDQHSRGRLALSSALRLAIEAGELVLHYQPQVDLKSGEIAGFEALVRWNHPELGLLGPDSFVGLAEEMGIIAAVDRWALNCALQQAHAWQAAAGLDLPIAVNLSMRNVLDERLTRVVGELLTKWDIPPSQLELEITESSIMADPSKVQSVLAQCRALGVRIAIDDFGTGYSSLAYLKRLPVDSLKIDKSFVSDVVADKSNLAIVRSTIELGHNLGLHVVAEGVEDERTGRLLSQLRCDVAQGHHFSVPLPGEDVLPWLARSRWRRTVQKYAA